MATRDDRLEVRVDPAFKARLKAAAKADHRSLSSFVISRLEAALSSSETPEAAREFDTSATAVSRRLASVAQGKPATAYKPRPKGDAKAKKR